MRQEFNPIYEIQHNAIAYELSRRSRHSLLSSSQMESTLLQQASSIQIYGECEQFH